MRFNIREMKKQGIFMGILAAFLTVIIVISYVTSLTPSVPTEEPEPDQSQAQTQSETNTEQNQSQQGTGTQNNTIEVPKPHTHSWSKGSTVKATCDEGGYTINTCSCGQSKTTNETEKLGHKLGEWVTEEPDEQGVIYKVRKCERCDFYEKEKVATVGETPDNNPENENLEDENPDTPSAPGGDGEIGGEDGGEEEENPNPNPSPNPDETPNLDQSEENQ